MGTGRSPFAGKMLMPMGKVRRLRGVRAALLVAACFAASSAFGLHPEPGSAPTDRTLAIRATTAAVDAPATHDCLACPAHRPLVASSTPAEVTAPQTSVTGPDAALDLAVRAFPVLSKDGRSPPSPS